MIRSAFFDMAAGGAIGGAAVLSAVTLARGQLVLAAAFGLAACLFASYVWATR